MEQRAGEMSVICRAGGSPEGDNKAVENDMEEYQIKEEKEKEQDDLKYTDSVRAGETLAIRNTHQEIFRFESRLRRYRSEQYIQMKEQRQKRWLQEEEGVTDQEEDHFEVEVRKRQRRQTRSFKGRDSSSDDLEESERKRNLIHKIIALRLENEILRDVLYGHKGV